MKRSIRFFSLVLLLPILLMSVLTARADTVHVVQTGDSLFRIALQYGTTVDSIVQANNLVNPNLIYVGQELVIPGADGTTAPVPSVPVTTQPTTTQPTPADTTGATAPTTGDVIHVVQTGDSLFRIAVNYNVQLADIVAANNLVNPSLIYVGQELLIPGATSTGATTTPATTTTAPAAEAPAPVTPADPVPAAPVVTSGNLFPNGSFEGDWHFYLYNELQIPDGWQVVTDEGPVTVTDDPNDVFFRPEIRVVSTAALPENEHALFIFDGFKTVKAFKGGAPTSFALFTDVPLQPGTYRMTVSFFPDIVAQYYPGGSREWSSNAVASEMRFIHNGGGTGYEATGAGQRVTRTYDFTVTQPETVRLGAAFRSRFPAANNGYF
ncbi:MAG: LysM peptidoglycan-binding domain-containing protein, partial [Chloroflexota bacterium]